MNPLDFLKEHPVGVAVGVFVVGAAFLLLRGGGSSGSSDASAYYAAEAQTAAAGDQVQLAQIETTAQTAQTTIAANAAQNIQSTWATTDQAINQQNTNAAVSEAPFAAELGVAGDIAQVAALPPITTTTTKKNNGILFGLFGGGGSSTTTTTSPNPNATDALNQLEALIGSSGAGGFVAGH